MSTLVASSSSGDSMKAQFWLQIKSNPCLETLASKCDKVFFDGKLRRRIIVKWIGSMTRSAGSTEIRQLGGRRVAVIHLSKPLLQPIANNDFIETLIHEMIHAYIGLVEKLPFQEQDGGHGPIFLKHAKRINEITGLKISAYHNMDKKMHEVRQYWWACDGPCRYWPPYYGLLKKVNRSQPSNWDLRCHEPCPGTFHRVKIPNENVEKSKSSFKKSKRPSLIVRRSLIVPSPIANRSIYLFRTRPIQKPSPKSAKVSYNFVNTVYTLPHKYFNPPKSITSNSAKERSVKGNRKSRKISVAA